MDGKGWHGFTRDYNQCEGAFDDNGEAEITNLQEYIDDANYIIKNGQYTPELNGYVKFMEEKVMQNMVS